MLRPCLALSVLLVACVILSRGPAAESETKMLKIQARQRVQSAGAKQDAPYTVSEKTVEWDPKHTALIVCDMWDDHWCKGRPSRVAEMAGPMNRLIARRAASWAC